MKTSVKSMAPAIMFGLAGISASGSDPIKIKANTDAVVFCKNSIHIQASPDKVWKVLTNINQWPSWNSKISKATVVDSVSENGRFNWKVNGANIQSRLHTVQENRIFGWTGTTFGGSAIHNWKLIKTENGTELQVEESMQGWLVSLFKAKMNKDLATDMAYWLNALKVESEK